MQKDKAIINAQKIISAALIAAPASFDEIRAIIAPEMLFNPYKEIFEAVETLVGEGYFITVTTVLARYPHLTDAISEALGVFDPDAAILSAEFLRSEYKTSQYRKIIESEIKDLAAGKDYKEVLTASIEARAALAAGNEKTKTKIVDVFDRYYKHYFEDEQTSPATPFGIPAVDAILGGWFFDDNIFLAARPGMGKTTLGLNVAEAAAQAGKAVAIFSLEMSETQLMQKFVSTKVGIPVERQNLRDYYKGEREAVAAAREYYRGLNVTIVDDCFSIAEIENKAYEIKNATGLDLIVLDYIQLMPGAARVNRNEQLSIISRGLVRLGKRLSAARIILSQLTREADGVEPQLKHLRDSGALEQDANIIVFIHKYNEQNDNERSILIKKNRRGRVGSIPVTFSGSRSRFSGAASDEFSDNGLAVPASSVGLSDADIFPDLNGSVDDAPF